MTGVGVVALAGLVVRNGIVLLDFVKHNRAEGHMGLNKALHPEAFLKLVRQYELVQSPLMLNLIAAGLPWFEVFCGVLLVLGLAVRGSALKTTAATSATTSC